MKDVLITREYKYPPQPCPFTSSLCFECKFIKCCPTMIKNKNEERAPHCFRDKDISPCWLPNSICFKCKFKKECVEPNDMACGLRNIKTMIDEELKNSDDHLDKLERLVGDLYELRNALREVGNPELAERMKKFAVEVDTHRAKIKYSHSIILKFGCDDRG
jgi:hypothetical protein